MRIVILGAGYSGTALALELVRSRPHLRPTLVESSARFGPGLAYGAAEERHALNVRAGRMGAFADAPNDFARWAIGTADDVFAPRPAYGRYLEALLEAAHERVERVAGRAVAITPAGNEFTVRLADGRTLAADHVVLALGNPAPARPRFADAFGEYWVNDPWDAVARNKLAGRDGAILVLGTGLTMVDVVQSLRAAGHRAPLIALSRRGLLPNIHRAPRAWPPFLDDMHGAPLAKIVRRVRDEVDRAATQGVDWRQVLEGARPSVQALWRAADPATRKRFLRWLRPYWDVHRHRLPRVPAVHVTRLRRSGVLRIEAGRIIAAERARDSVRLTVALRGGGEIEHRVAGGINCTGPDHDYARSEDPLLQQLLRDRMIACDPFGLGLVVDTAWRVVDGLGKAQPQISALGPPTRGAVWEITSVPDIREQVAELADRLLADVPA
ncbi:FAD/NAD(P)-binding protein [Roseiterribacter gracilis]|uniref:Pyridine nucleotide-disulfide oxidoreductase n=1 Tax=Roseiterribacter gracilis TaxID=2812848 RepID=A0A8S8XB70_9PROT|nr:pyridine nucleotide-disulfide oxidoreductase [Rhodospirillales bacterium TMPK1]